MRKTKKIMLLIVLSLLMAIPFSGSALSDPDAEHSIRTNEYGCWNNPLENSEGHYREEDGYWIVLKV